jgi:glycogen phosphorylase
MADKSMNDLKEYRLYSSETVSVTTSVQLGNIDPGSVKVEVYYGTVNKHNVIEPPEIVQMKLEERGENGFYRYSAAIRILEGGEYGYTFRVVPHHPDLINKFDMGLVRWVVQ